MPNKRGVTFEDVEQAHPWPPGRFAEPEPQDSRGAPGSRDVGDPVRSRERPAGPRGGRREPLRPSEWSGVNPLPPVDERMPVMKPGDQGG